MARPRKPWAACQRCSERADHGALCTKHYFQDYHVKHREEAQDRRLRATYGLSVEGYRALFDLQLGRCAICGTEPGARALAVDHDHATGAVRGLLCSPCNRALGGFRDDAKLLARAAQYLEDRHGRH